jgi:hypothetical protein
VPSTAKTAADTSVASTACSPLTHLGVRDKGARGGEQSSHQVEGNQPNHQLIDLEDVQLIIKHLQRHIKGKQVRVMNDATQLVLQLLADLAYKK